MPKPAALTANLVKAEKESLEGFKAWSAQSAAASAALSAWAISESGESPELMTASLKLSSILSACSSAQSNYLSSLSGYRMSLQDVLSKEASLRQTTRDREILLAKLIKTSGKSQSAPTSGPNSLEGIQKELIACEAALRNETAALEGARRRTFKEAIGMRLRCLEDMGQEWVKSAREATEMVDALGTGTGLAVNTPAREKENILENLPSLVGRQSISGAGAGADTASLVESISPSHSASQVGRDDSKRDSSHLDSAQHSRSVSVTSEAPSSSTAAEAPISPSSSHAKPPTPPAAIAMRPSASESTPSQSTDGGDRSPTLNGPSSIISTPTRERDGFSTPLAASIVSDRPGLSRNPSSAPSKRPAVNRVQSGVPSERESIKLKAKAAKDLAKQQEKERKEQEKREKEEKKKASKHQRKSTSETIVVEETASESSATAEPVKRRKAKQVMEEEPKTKERVVIVHKGGGSALARRQSQLRRGNSQTGSFNEAAAEKAIIGDVGRNQRAASPTSTKSKGVFGGLGSLFGKKKKETSSAASQTATERFLDRPLEGSDEEGSLPDSPRSRKFSVFGLGKRDSTWSSRTDKNLSKAGLGEPRGTTEKLKRKASGRRATSVNNDSDDESVSPGVVRVVNEGGPPLWRNRALSDANGDLARAASVRERRASSASRTRLPGHQAPPPRKAMSDVGAGEWQGTGLHLRKGSRDFPEGIPEGVEAPVRKRRQSTTSTKDPLSRSGTLASMSNVSVATAPPTSNAGSTRSTGPRRKKTQTSSGLSKGAANLMSIVDPPLPPSPLRQSFNASQPPPPTPPAAVAHASSSPVSSTAPPLPVLPSTMLDTSGVAPLADGRARNAPDNASLLAASSPSKSYAHEHPTHLHGEFVLSPPSPTAANGPAPSPPPTLPKLPPALPKLQLPSEMMQDPSPQSSTSSTPLPPPHKPQSILVSSGSDVSVRSSSAGSPTGASLKRPKSVRMASSAKKTEAIYVNSPPPASASSPPPAAQASAIARASSISSGRDRRESSGAGARPSLDSNDDRGRSENPGWQTRIRAKDDGAGDSSEEDDDGKEYMRVRRMLSKSDKAMKGSMGA